MNEKSPSWIRLNQVILRGQKVGVVLYAFLRSVYVPGSRSLFHLSVLLLIVLALSLSGLDPFQFSLSVNVAHPTVAPTLPPHVAASSPATVRGVERQSSVPPSRPAAAVIVQNLVQAPVPHTIIPERPRKGVITYTVQAGDNVFSIAEQFGLEHETVIWSNKELETDPDMLYIGQELNILPIDGVYHTVGDGETLTKIAEQYKVSVEAITGCVYNGLPLDDYRIVPGQKLIVPDGIKPFKPRFIRFQMGTIPKDAPRGKGNFIWPVGGHISQKYWNLHRAIDIVGTQGDVVVAADAGVVVYAAWERSGYGNLVIIDHGNGYISYYAHLYGFYVDVGQSIERGQPIGARGTTGRSTGSHLHFEIRHNGIQRNPLGFLPRQ